MHSEKEGNEEFIQSDPEWCSSTSQSLLSRVYQFKSHKPQGHQRITQSLTSRPVGLVKVRASCTNTHVNKKKLTWSADEIEDNNDEDVRLLIERTLSPLLLPICTFFSCSLSILQSLNSHFYVVYVLFLLFSFCLCSVFLSPCVFVSYPHSVVFVHPLLFHPSYFYVGFFVLFSFIFSFLCFSLLVLFFFFSICSFPGFYKAKECLMFIPRIMILGVRHVHPCVLREKLGTCRTVCNALYGRGILGRDVNPDLKKVYCDFLTKSIYSRMKKEDDE